MSASSKTIAFLGATGGCGLSALGRSVAAGSFCNALCRTPSKLMDKFPAQQYPNLITVQGNAKDPAAVAKILVNPSDPKRVVDMVIFTIGGVFQFSKMTNDDPHVCEQSMKALLKALATVWSEGVVGKPKIVAISSTGISKYARDIPLLMVPLYHLALKIPHADKELMEQELAKSGEEYVLVRPSALVDGERPEKNIRVGIEDLEKGIERKEIGCTISREDTGRWIYENLIDREWTPEYSCKAVSLTY